MKFNVIIGNPPYQETTGGGRTGKTAKSLYSQFIKNGIKLTDNVCIMITPSKWFNMPDEADTRAMLIKDYHLKSIVDYMNSKDIFQGVDIAGGVSYFLYSTSYVGNTDMKSHNRNRVEEFTLPLNADSMVYRSKHIAGIVEKVSRYAEKNNFSAYASGQSPFGLTTNAISECSVIETGEYNIQVLGARGKTGYIDRKSITKGNEFIDCYKVITNHVTSEHAGEADKNGMVRVISNPQILQPRQICTQTYMILCGTDNMETARNIQSYFNTKLVRLLVWITTTSISLSVNNFRFVPYMDFSHKWTDSSLYDAFALSEEEIDYIEKMIKTPSIP